MKKIILSIHFLLYVLVLNASEIQAVAKITNATVYLQGATVYTTSSVQIPQGVSTVVISKQSQYIDANSIQVSGKGSFTILSVQKRTNYLDKQEQSTKIKELDAQRKRLDLQFKQIQNENQVYATEEKLLEKNMELKGVNSGLSVAELEKAANFYRGRLLDIHKNKLDNSVKLTQLQEQIRDIDNQLQELRKGVKEPVGEIVITVSTKQAQQVQLFASYYIAQAGWEPFYDIRVKDVVSPAKITYRAKVYQNSGFQWNNIELNLSTGNPTLGGTAPSLQTWLLHRQNPPMPKMKYAAPATRKMEEVVADDMELMSLGYSSGVSASFVRTEVLQKTTTTEFSIVEPVTVLSGENQSLVVIQEYDISAQYTYICVPKLDTDVFLQAAISGYEVYNFLSGTANLFFEGAYVGESYLDLDKAKDSLIVSLGRDKGVVVERKRVDDFNAKKVFGAKRKELQTWEISVKNNKSHVVQLLVQDQIPISGQSEIEVSDVSYAEGSLHKETGTITWRLQLEKSAVKKLRVSYQITYPKDWLVNTK